MDVLGKIRRWHFRDGLSIREISKTTTLSRNTIRKYLRDDVVEPAHPAREAISKLDAFSLTLKQWLETDALLPPNNVVDDFNRQALHIEIDTSITSERLIRVFERLKRERGLPQVLRTDNGPEFLGEAFAQWAKNAGMAIQYIQPASPIRMPTSSASTARCARSCCIENKGRSRLSRELRF